MAGSISLRSHVLLPAATTVSPGRRCSARSTGSAECGHDATTHGRAIERRVERLDGVDVDPGRLGHPGREGVALLDRSADHPDVGGAGGGTRPLTWAVIWNPVPTTAIGPPGRAAR